MIKKPISYYINKEPNKKQEKKITTRKEEENKKDDKINNNNLEFSLLEKIDKKISKLSFEEKNIYLKEKINEIQIKNGNNSKLLFDVISRLININLISGDLAFNKGDYNLSLEKYKECLQLNEPLPGSEWSKYPEWFNLRINIFNSIASTYEKLNKKEQAIEYIKLSFNLEDKNNINIENKNKSNDIIFMAGKQLILSGNYNEALKYLTKAEKNIYEEFCVEKILKRGKIDENYDKNFMNNNPDEYIYLLNLIYKCYIKKKDYDLGEKYYQRYEEMYNILNKIKKVKYPFKGIDDNSDSDINDELKINNNDKKTKSNFYKKINDNFLINNNRMIDKAEDEYHILSLNEKRYKSESKERKNNEKEEEKNINNNKYDNNNKGYLINNKQLSWGKEKNNTKKLNIDINKNKIPVPKNKNKIKNIKLSNIKMKSINNINIKLNNSLNNISNISNIKEKAKKNYIKITFTRTKNII